MKTSIALCFICILVTQVSAKKACEMETIKECLRNELAKAALTGTVTTFAAFVYAKLTLWMAGFSAIGPVGGSLAAWLQAAYGIGPIFSLLQSLAMGKLTLLLGPAVAVGCVAAFIYWVASCLKIDCIFSDEEKESNEDEQSYWDKVKNFVSKYYRIIISKADFIREVFEYAINLLWEEYYKSQEQSQSQQQTYQVIRKFLQSQKKCYQRRSTPNTIYEILTFIS